MIIKKIKDQLAYSTLTFFFVGILLIPQMSQASVIKPSCTLTVHTEQGVATLRNNQTVLFVKGDTLEIEWKSKNADKAIDSSGEVIPLSGSSTSSPEKDRILTYKFSAKNNTVICKATVHVVEGSINSSSLSFKSANPTLSGKVFGTKSVQIKVYKKGSTVALYTSKVIKVKNGVWSTKVTKKLVDGTYSVVLFGEKQAKLNTIVKSDLTIGEKTFETQIKKETSSTTFVTELVPLLVGGIAKAGTTVAISYLQVINIGTTDGTIQSFKIKQNGSAPVDIVEDLSVFNEQGLLATIHKPVFVDGTATIPVTLLMGPRSMQLFTIKAIIGANIALQVNKQLKLDVASVGTNASMQSVFPIRGTIWTLGF